MKWSYAMARTRMQESDKYKQLNRRISESYVDKRSDDIETVGWHQRDDNISKDGVPKKIAQREAACLFLQVLYALDNK